MGVGKTLEFIGVWVFHRSVAVAWHEVQTCRKSSDPASREKHLPASQKEGSVCPTNPFPNLACPCVNGSMSHLIAQQIKQGPVLMLAPGGNVSVWEEECRKRVDTANRRLRLKWHVAYEKSILSQQTIQGLRCDAEMLEAKKDQNRHLVIASNQSFYNRVIQPALMRRQHSQSTYETSQEARHPITWSIMGRDEYHLAKATNTLPSQYFFVARTCSEKAEKFALNLPQNRQAYQPQPHQDNPLQIAMTRTPFEGSPIDLARHINRKPSPKCITNDHSMARCNPTELR